MGCCVGGGGWRQAGLIVGMVDGFWSGVDGLTIVINWIRKSVKEEKKVLKERWNGSSRRKERSLRV
jgi:hypothetical protein